jgi:hypothetical protein
MINQIHNMPKRIKRNGRVLDKLKKVRELLRLHGAINEVIPEADGVTLIWMANSHTPKLSVKPEDVPPPKGTLFSCQMWNKTKTLYHGYPDFGYT